MNTIDSLSKIPATSRLYHVVTITNKKTGTRYNRAPAREVTELAYKHLGKTKGSNRGELF